MTSTSPAGAEARLAEAARQHAALYRFVARLQAVGSLAAICDAGLDAMLEALVCQRASILLADDHGVMRFAGWRGLSDGYRGAVEGHSAWAPDERNPRPVLVPDIARADMDAVLRARIQGEGIVALGFFPLMIGGRLAGKFMTYYDAPHAFAEVEVEVALNIARQLALAIERNRAEQTLRAGEQRLRLALEAGGMGSWEWNMRTNEVVWSPELEAIHGLAPGTFDGTFEAYQRDIHPDDRAEVERQIGRSLEHGEHRLEYRIIRPDGALRWVEGRGKVFRDEAGNPVRIVGVCTDVTDRKLAEAAGIEAQRRKDEFLATLAHELRNPLAPISNALHLVKSSADPTTQEQAVSIMERQLAHMVRLVDDLLDVSRISRGTLQLRMEDLDLAQVVRNAVETVLPVAERRGLAIDVGALPAVRLRGDAVRLAQTFSNLLHNACKFSPPGRRVAIAATRAGAEVVVDVVDQGIGIDAPHLDSIFEMFSQVDNSMTRAENGLGIGLALARRIVEMHGGTLRAHSDGLGKGSTFSVTLPVAKAAGNVAGIDVRSAATAANGRRILVVEDNADAAWTLAAMLQLAGNDVAVTHDPESALRRAQEVRPDAVVLDLGLPGMSGYDVCRLLREQQGTRDALIIAVSGWGQDEDRRLSSQAGFDAHLVKPVGLAALNDALARAHDAHRDRAA